MSQLVNLPQGTLVFPDLPTLPPGLVLAGGRKPAVNWLTQVGANCKEIFVADKGLNYAVAAGLKPSLVVGDGDSADAALWTRAKSETLVKEFPVAKDHTDLQLLLQELPPDRLYLCSGVWGGRYDHLYSAVHSLAALVQKCQLPVLIADERELMVLLPAGKKCTFTPPPEERPQAVSVLPLCGKTCCSLSGVRWPLEHAVLTESDPYAVSNELVKESLEFTSEDGIAALYIAG